MKSLGYATGQFGRITSEIARASADRARLRRILRQSLSPNAEEEPENPDYPKDPRFRVKFGPRGVLMTKATDKDDPTIDPAFGRDGKQTIENTGALDTKRMETVDEEFLARGQGFHQPSTDGRHTLVLHQHDAHARLHAFEKSSQGKTGLGLYPDGMVETDGHVGELLKLVDDLGVANNTIVVYTSDNGAEAFTWPDGGSTPFRSEKATNFEGAFRVPCLIRWPGVIAPGTIVNDICAHEDFIPTFAAAAGEAGLVDKLVKGTTLNGKSFKVHLDGYNLMPYFKGGAKDLPRDEIMYWSDDGDLMAMRFRNWKVAFMEQHTEMNPETPLGVWQGQFTKLRIPKLYNLRADPFEKATTSIYYGDWSAHRMFMLVPAQAFVAKWLESFKDFPPRSKAASFSVNDAMDQIQTNATKD